MSNCLGAATPIRVISGEQDSTSAVHLIHSSVDVDLVLSGLITSLQSAFTFSKGKNVIITFLVVESPQLRLTFVKSQGRFHLDLA